MNFIKLSSDGNLYYLINLVCQRGMRNQKAKEVLIHGFNINCHHDQYIKLLNDLFDDDVVSTLLGLDEYLIEW